MHQLFLEINKAYDLFRREILYNILIHFGIPMNLVRLIKTCLAETYSRVWVGKNLSEMCPVRNGLVQGDHLLPLLFNISLEYAIGSVQVNGDGWQLYCIVLYLLSFLRSSQDYKIHGYGNSQLSLIVK